MVKLNHLMNFIIEQLVKMGRAISVNSAKKNILKNIKMREINGKKNIIRSTQKRLDNMKRTVSVKYYVNIIMT